MMRAFFTTLVFGAAASVSAQQIIVLPAVSDNTPGVNGSVWVTELQIIKKDHQDSLTVRRKWVCVEDDGFAEIPETALSWDMSRTGAEGRLLTLHGSDLLAGTNSNLGAVALEIEGGEAITNARVADVSRGTMFGGVPFGQGQLIPTGMAPLIGPSHLPWLGGCRNYPCSLEPPIFWDYYRNNIGIVNPNPEPMVVSAVVIPFGDDGFPAPVEIEIYDGEPESFTRLLPPFGWTQFSWVAEQLYGPSLWVIHRIARAGFIISLTPDNDLPYFAYASVIFSPDSDSGIPAFNDPMFVPAQSGFVAPYRRED